MGAYEWLTLVACAGHLALALLTILRGSRSRLRLPLAVLCMEFFGISAANLALGFSPLDGWAVMNATVASLLPPVVLHFMLVFIGRRRQLQWLLVAYYTVFGAIALACALSPLVAVLRSFPRSVLWAELVAVLAAPMLVLTPMLLIQHLRRASTVLERGRTYLVIATFFMGASGCLADLFYRHGTEIPRLANVGFLLSTLLLATVALRFGLFERRVSALLVFNAVVIGFLQVLGYLAVFHFFASNGAMLLLGTITVSIAVLPSIRELARAWSTQRHRTEYLATLGRFAAQMAHDVKNPLAAVKGAAQYLQVEGARDGWSTDQREYVDLIIGEVDRLSRVVGDYQRVGRAEAALAPLQVNDLIRSVVASQTLVARAGVTLTADLEKAVPFCHADHDLVVRALENLIHNAFDALPDGGAVTLRSGVTSTDPPCVILSVVDTGHGMNARVREKAFDDFYTTKANGSGLGLAFVKRIAEAHGGEVALDSEEGRGTTVQLRLRAVSV